MRLQNAVMEYIRVIIKGEQCFGAMIHNPCDDLDDMFTLPLDTFFDIVFSENSIKTLPGVESLWTMLLKLRKISRLWGVVPKK